jgi:hypothetical protein
MKVTGELTEKLPENAISISRDFVRYIEIKFDYLREYRKEHKEKLFAELIEYWSKLNKQEQELIAVHWIK